MNNCHQFSFVVLGLAGLRAPDELEELPFRYRLLVKMFLRLPNPSLPFFILKRLPEFEGIFWGVVVPVLLIVYCSFSVWFFSFLSLFVVFPLNVIFGLITPAVVFVFFLRIQLERAILWWRNIHETSKKWETSKRVEELIELFQEQRRKRSS